MNRVKSYRLRRLAAICYLLLVLIPATARAEGELSQVPSFPSRSDGVFTADAIATGYTAHIATDLDFSGLIAFHTITLTANRTITLSNFLETGLVPTRKVITIAFTQDATGGRTVTWPAAPTVPAPPVINLAPSSVTYVTVETTDAGTSFTATSSYAEPDKNLRILQALGSTIKAQTLATDRITTTSGNLGDGVARFSAIYIANTQTVTGVKWWVNAQGVYTPDNNNYIGLYSHDGAGTLTLRAITANDGTIWSALGANNLNSAAFVAPYLAVPGVYYIATLYNNSAQTTAPILGGTTNVANAGIAGLDFTNSAVTTGNSAAGQNTLPSSLAISLLTSTNVQPWLALY